MKALFTVLAAAAVCAVSALPSGAQSGSFFQQGASLEASVAAAASRMPAAVEPATAPRLDPKDPYYFDKQVRTALIERLKRNPVAARFAVPVLEADPSIRFDIRDEKGADNWASYNDVSRVYTLYRDEANKDIAQLNDKHLGDCAWAPIAPLEPGQPLDARQTALICDRYLPLIVHEVGGHARHYGDLRALMDRRAMNVYETELDALRLEAMAVTWERLQRSEYLDDGTGYGTQERDIGDAFAKSFKRGYPDIFKDYVKTALKNYDKLPAITALSGDELTRLAAAHGFAAESLTRERDYFVNEGKLLDAAQRDLFSSNNLPDYPDDSPGERGGFGGRGRL